MDEKYYPFEEKKIDKDEKTNLLNEQIIQKKINDIKPFIKNIDFTNLPKRQ